jgi:ubiquinone/menaquinone biosynthesis C-methylase UbiE
VGVGSGGNLPWLARDLPRGLDVELWGVDLSEQMLAHCRRRLAEPGSRPVRLVLADGHALPFPDASFDRVYNVGGIGTYADPRRALAEMARVARPGTPIVVVDEQLDPGVRHPLYYRLVFRALTLYDPAPRSPIAYLPPEAVDVTDEQVSRFYYCLTFSVPPPAAARTRQ